MLLLSNVEMPIIKTVLCLMSSSVVICCSITRRSWSTADNSYYYYYYCNRTINYWDSIISITLSYCTDKVCI